MNDPTNATAPRGREAGADAQEDGKNAATDYCDRTGLSCVCECVLCRQTPGTHPLLSDCRERGLDPRTVAHCECEVTVEESLRHWYDNLSTESQFQFWGADRGGAMELVADALLHGNIPVAVRLAEADAFWQSVSGQPFAATLPFEKDGPGWCDVCGVVHDGPRNAERCV